MKKRNNWIAGWFLAVCVMVAGCGYTTKSLLPEHIKAVHVEQTANAINLSEEITEKTPFRVYRPGLEVEITNAITNRYIFDGTLKVTPLEKADAVLSVTLVDYRRDALRYTDGEDVEEYRLSVTIDAAFKQKADGKVLWSKRLTGDSTFFLTGPRSTTEDQAASRAVEDLARRVIENTIEVW